ncbi:hypothetical protein ATANTOWER_014791 [Ataeniobius toweri]|uniref:Uncharacterized protein n=1 Tax=Ataeniobius toweri TaxID=208326 RepID=A0ABU7AP85_9TELE|nr:hypothetical protein [Ataeniobius toweri]
MFLLHRAEVEERRGEEASDGNRVTAALITAAQTLALSAENRGRVVDEMPLPVWTGGFWHTLRLKLELGFTPTPDLSSNPLSDRSLLETHPLHGRLL